METPPSETAADLTSAVLAEEEARRSEQERERVVLAEDLLPGVGDEEMSLREGLKVGGVSTIALLGMLNAWDELDAAAASLLAPEIQDTLDVSDTVIAVVTVGGSVLLVAGGLGLARLADNMRRTTIVGLATIFWSAIVFVTGFVANAFWYFIARSFTALGKSNTQPVQGPILADAYPIGVRARIYAVNNVVGRVGGLIAPLAIAGVVVVAGGDEGWRWAFWIAAWPTLLIGIIALRADDPPRGQFEQKSTIGEVLIDDDAPPISIGATYQRISRIRTYKAAITAFSALGFTFVSVPLFMNLYLDERFDLGPFERALVNTFPGIAALAVVPMVAKRFDGLYRQSPPRALALIGSLFLPLAVLIPLQLAMPNAVLFAVFGVVPTLITSAVFAMVGPLFANVNPYRIRSQGTAIGTGMILGIGGVGGAVIGGLLSDAFGERVAITALVVPANLIGGLVLMNGARFIRDDLSLVVEEIREEQAEHERMAAHPDDIPVLQLRNIDFSYGHVQVLFDVELEVSRGETLALLGTNGAGKSTLLKVASGLAVPQRGVVRLDGRTMTLTAPETRVGYGIHHVPGGEGLFAPMTVRNNLVMAGYLYRRDTAELDRRIDRALEVFPQLAERMADRAGDLSGGQQQMLNLAMAIMHDPEVLLIDELTLGLAPVTAQDVVGVVEGLKEAGQTMVIVEQSLNVAAAVADRAVFMERGRIRFEGSPAALLEHDDLARAVFLGGERG